MLAGISDGTSLLYRLCVTNWYSQYRRDYYLFIGLNSPPFFSVCLLTIGFSFHNPLQHGTDSAHASAALHTRTFKKLLISRDMFCQNF